MKCRMESKLNAYLEKELAKEEQEIIQKHLDTCSQCRATLQELQEMNEILNKYEEQDVPEHVIHSIYKKIQIRPQVTGHRRIVNFGIAAAVLFSFFSGLWFSNKVFLQPESSEQLFELGSESLYSFMQWEEE